MHDHEPDPRRDVVREMLIASGHPATDEEIDAVIAGLDSDLPFPGWRYHPEIHRFGADPADIDY